MNHDFEKPVLWSLELELSLAPSLQSKAGVHSCVASLTHTKATTLFQSLKQLLCGGNNCFLLVCVR